MRRVLVTVAVLLALTVGLGQAVPAHNRTLTGAERTGRMSPSTHAVVDAAGSTTPRSLSVCRTVGPRTVCRGRQVAYNGHGAEWYAWQLRREHKLRVKAESRAHARTLASSGGSLYAIRLASIAYGVPYGTFTAVARCETGGNYSATAYNPRSGASGLMQFLPGTFAGTPYSSLSIFDPFASALAAGWLYVQDGRSFKPEWTCG